MRIEISHHETAKCSVLVVSMHWCGNSMYPSSQTTQPHTRACVWVRVRRRDITLIAAVVDETNRHGPSGLVRHSDVFVFWPRSTPFSCSDNLSLACSCYIYLWRGSFFSAATYPTVAKCPSPLPAIFIFSSSHILTSCSPPPVHTPPRHMTVPVALFVRLFVYSVLFEL